MKEELSDKIKSQFANMAIYKDPTNTNSLFVGRNLPSFVKDFILKRFIKDNGKINEQLLTAWLDEVIPQESVKDKLGQGEQLTLLVRFVVYIDLVKNIYRFAIPDLGIKLNEGRIPEYVFSQHKGTLVDGELWGIIKICLLPDDDGKKFHVEMVDYKPFKPYKSVDMTFLREARQHFTTTEWIDFILSAMEYDASGFKSMQQK